MKLRKFSMMQNKVYQRVVDRGHGDCMQAAMATLTGSTYEETPAFIKYKHDFHTVKVAWMFVVHDCALQRTLYNMPWHIVKMNREKEPGDRAARYVWYQHVKMLKRYAGIGGLFYGTVYSPKYFDESAESQTTHAVLIDTECNVVFDPNPEYAGLESYPIAGEIGHNGVVMAEVFQPMTSRKRADQRRRYAKYYPRIMDYIVQLETGTFHYL